SHVEVIADRRGVAVVPLEVDGIERDVVNPLRDLQAVAHRGILDGNADELRPVAVFAVRTGPNLHRPAGPVAVRLALVLATEDSDRIGETKAQPDRRVVACKAMVENPDEALNISPHRGAHPRDILEAIPEQAVR